MCGICGIIQHDPHKNVDLALLKKMVEKLRHRGPDDDGYYLSSGVGLGHCRLSIIDLKSGHQPMTNENETLWLVFNGAIYNYIELRNLLINKGHIFRSQSDTEVILHGYEEFGTQIVDHLEGMFAFALFDQKKEEMLLARDHFGIKPLYYALLDDFFIFASEIKALLLVIEPSLNIQAFADYLTFQYVLGEKTMFKNIYKLMPASYMTVKHGKIIGKKTYWKIQVNNLSRDLQPDIRHENEARLASLVEQSIRNQLRSDVPLGSHLSGGIDTAVIHAGIKRIAPRKITHSFSAGFSGEAEIYDDSHYTQISAKHFNTKHHFIHLGPMDFLNNFQKINYHLDEPVAGPGSIPQFFVSKLAASTVKVVLGGQGADEIFGGYTRYYLFYLESVLREHIFNSQENTGMDLQQLLPGLPQLKKYQALMVDYFRGGPFKDRPQMYYRMILRSRPLAAFLSVDALDELKDYSPFEEYESLFRAGEGGDLLNQVLHYETSTWLPALLQVEDRMSMAWSLESRVPFLEKKLCEFAFSLPASEKISQGTMKAALRNAFKKELPQPVANRTDKIGFPVPIHKWMNGPLAEELKNWLPLKRTIFNSTAIEEFSSISKEHNRELWGLMNIEMWFTNFFDNATNVSMRN